jgi:hypothetical protein
MATASAEAATSACNFLRARLRPPQRSRFGLPERAVEPRVARAATAPRHRILPAIALKPSPRAFHCNRPPALAVDRATVKVRRRPTSPGAWTTSGGRTCF